MILSELDELIAILSPALIAAFVGFIRYFHDYFGEIVQPFRSKVENRGGDAHNYVN